MRRTMHELVDASGGRGGAEWVGVRWGWGARQDGHGEAGHPREGGGGHPLEATHPREPTQPRQPGEGPREPRGGEAREAAEGAWEGRRAREARGGGGRGGGLLDVGELAVGAVALAVEEVLADALGGPGGECPGGVRQSARPGRAGEGGGGRGGARTWPPCGVSTTSGAWGTAEALPPKNTGKGEPCVRGRRGGERTSQARARCGGDGGSGERRGERAGGARGLRGR